MAGAGMKFGMPPWMKKASEPEQTSERALVKYTPAVLTGADEANGWTNGWTPEALAEYRAEADARAMGIVAASMEGRMRPRPKWANNQYSPLRWHG